MKVKDLLIEASHKLNELMRSLFFMSLKGEGVLRV